MVFGVVVRSFPRDVIARLCDRSNWTRARRLWTTVGKVLSSILFVLMAFSPLQMGHPVFVAGSGLYVLGLIGLVIALFNFRHAEPGRPATTGLYRVSRNPQWMTLVMVFGRVSRHRLVGGAAPIRPGRGLLPLPHPRRRAILRDPVRRLIPRLPGARPPAISRSSRHEALDTEPGSLALVVDLAESDSIAQPRKGRTTTASSSCPAAFSRPARGSTRSWPSSVLIFSSEDDAASRPATPGEDEVARSTRSPRLSLLPRGLHRRANRISEHNVG